MVGETPSDGRIRRGASPGRLEDRTFRRVARDETSDLVTPGGMTLRWSSCGDDLDVPGLVSVDGIFLADNRAVGCLSIQEFRLPEEADDDPDVFSDWVRRMLVPGADAVAEAMREGWRPGDVRELGALVWFSRIWVEPAHARGGVWPTVDAFLDARYRSGGPEAGALLLLKPFPLEYEFAFSMDTGVPQQPLEDRRAAMRRLYAARLGVDAIGAMDWMWRALDPRLPPPRPAPPDRTPPGPR